MDYMINIDLETKNVSGGATDCHSILHEDYGPHFDLTVHTLECGHRKYGGTYRPPTRYWDDRDGKGYILEEVVDKIKEIQAHHADVYPRRCRVCAVGASLPYWD